MRIRLAIALAALVAAGPGAARANDCTKGTDCYCDCVTQTPPSAACKEKYPGITHDSSLRLCMDFEQAPLYDGSGLANGAPEYGPAYDPTGSSAAYGRGFNSAWVQLYGNGASDCIRRNGEPANPRIGASCDTTNLGGGPCRETLEWCSEAQGGLVDGGGADCWQANDEACIDIYRAGEWNEEVPSLGELDPPDGRAALGLRNSTTADKNAGFSMTKSFERGTDIGITMITGISGNAFDSGSVTEAPWKFEEWGDATASAIFPQGATHGACSDDMKPFCPIVFRDPSQISNGTCATDIAGATNTVGAVSCTGPDDGTTFRWIPGNYNRVTDFALDTAHCVRGHISGIGSPNMSVKVWLDGDSAADLVIDVSGVNGTRVLDAAGWSFFGFDNYSNYKTGHSIPSAVRRMYDNVHIRAGAPVSCAQVGFTQCADGIDNDGDGLADYPADLQCWGRGDNSERLDCSDQIDNDGDGLVDYPADPGCNFSQLSKEDPQCNDGVDNDGDTLVDWPQDGGCAGAWDDDETPATPPSCGLLGAEPLVVGLPVFWRWRRRAQRHRC